MTERTSRRAARGPRSASSALDHITAALLPLARLSLDGGGGVEDFILAVKLAFVQAAAENAQLGTRLNVSAIAASTGLTRKDVRALLGLASQREKGTPRRLSPSPIMRVVEGWRTDPAFRDRAGRPAGLPMTGTGSFTDLVQRFAGDVTVVSVLKSLQRLGLVTRSSRSMIRLKTQIRKREIDYEAMLAEVMERVGDLATTLVNNVKEPEHPVYAGVQRTAIPADQAVLFQAEFAERASSLLDGLRRWAASRALMEKRESPPSSNLREVGLGIYLFNRPALQAPVRRPRAPRPRR